MPAGGRSVADPADAEALAARLGDIAGKTSLSRARQEKQISAALREALTAAVPEFVDTVADAAAFTPAVRRLPKGAAQVRAAAYGATKASPPAVDLDPNLTAARREPDQSASHSCLLYTSPSPRD